MLPHLLSKKLIFVARYVTTYFINPLNYKCMIKNPSIRALLKKSLKKVMLLCGIGLILMSMSSVPIYAASDLGLGNSGDLQQQKISGRVVDSKSNPMAGVNVLVKGTVNGVLTDANGSYTINAPSGAVLQFTFIGFETQEITVGNQSTINVTLQETVRGLEEVVVIGYGTVKKRDLTGSVSSVKSQDIIANAPTTVQMALQGKAAGIMVAEGNLVNSTPTLRVRGNRSTTSGANDPLFVVDGIPSTGGMETINPSDVESIEILKGASATAIYGARGANGVIMVTTKKGTAGKVTVEYDGYYSVGNLNRIRKAFNASEYVDYVRESARQYTYDGNGGYTVKTAAGYGYTDANYNADMSTTYLSAGWDPYVNESVKEGWVNGVWTPSSLRSFDWQMSGFRDNSSSENHSINIRGGTETTKVFVSGSYMNLTDIQLQSYRKRYTLRLNLDQSLGKRITMGGMINFSDINYNPGKGIGINWSPLGTPWYSAGNDITKPGDPANGLIPRPCGEPLNYNPFYDLDGVKRGNRNDRLLANLYFEAKIFNGLSYRANFGSDMYFAQSQYFYSHFSTATNLGNPVASQSISMTRGWTFDNILTYSKDFGDHSLTATFVQSNQKHVEEPISGTGNSLPIESQIWYSLGSAASQSCSSDYIQWTMMSWLGRINYSYKGKYLLTASIRDDGASMLAKGHKWVSFPSVALGWNLSKESFMQNISAISNLKLRAEYGVTGNSNVIGAYGTVGQVTSSRYNWDKTTGALGYAPLSLNSPLLTWEKTAQFNGGFDLGLLRDRINISLDLYLQKTSDLLMTRAIPTVSGFSTIPQNIGSSQNKGLEIGINSVNISTSKISWTTNLTFATNKEEITKLATGLDKDLTNSWFVGYPVDTYYDFVAAPKVWGYSKEDMDEMAKFNANGTNFKPGDLRLTDLNGDYKITDVDRAIIGQKMPKWMVSMANNFKYGPFDLYVFTYGDFGQTIYWDPGISIGGRYNTYKNSYWTPENTNTKWLEPHTDIQMPSNINAMYYWKGDFLKISDITLGYTLPAELTKKATISSVRFYVKVQNPFMFTNFEGVDPEGALAQVRVNGALTTYGDAPFTMTNYMFGVHVTF
jgi:TonB-linked SusC/RagA family outer membrane protein